MSDELDTTFTETKLNGATPLPASVSVSADLSLFDDLDAVRIADPALLGGDQELLVHMYVRKPKRDEYFRTHSDPEMQITTLVWIDEEIGGETYFVHPNCRAVMANSGRLVTLTLCQNRQGVNFLWPIPASTNSGGGKGWGESARAGAVRARTHWIKIKGDRSAGAYMVLEAAEQHGEPNWPTLSLPELLKLAFKNQIIDTVDHPIIRRLQGYVET